MRRLLIRCLVLLALLLLSEAGSILADTPTHRVHLPLILKNYNPALMPTPTLTPTPTVTPTATPIVLVGNKITLEPVARRWGATGWENLGCSTKIRITHAGPWEWPYDSCFWVIDFFDFEGEEIVFYGHYISRSQEESVFDLERHASRLGTSWCGTAVVTVHDDVSYPSDPLSEIHQVRVEVLRFCDCP